MDLQTEEQESMESSSDSGSEEEEGLESEEAKPGSDFPQGEDTAELGGEGSAGLEGSPGPEEESDGEMSSAVASASHQATKFLQDSDSEDEDTNKSKMEKQSDSETKFELQNVFGGGESDEEEDSPARIRVHKRRLSSGSAEEEIDQVTPPKRARINTSGSEEAGEEGLKAVHSPEDVDKEDSPFGNLKDMVDSDSEGEGGSSPPPVGGGSGEESGREEEEGEQQEEQASDDEIDDDKRIQGLSDWDIMMERRKEAMARARRRRNRDGDLTCNDEHIMAIILQMREAAEDDRQLNLARKAATKKIQLLPTVMAHLKKSDLQTTFIENGILTALAGWLTPLPDHSLPHLKIRESILDILKSYPIPDSSILKSSKIGKAVMLLYRHPKESKKNKAKAGKIINDWARPIFGLASDFKSMTRDERERRDYAHLSQEARHRISTGERRPSQDDDSEQPQKPGDKGWIGRARVPMPSTKGYMVRPKWNTEEYHKKGSSKKTLNRYEKHLRKTKQEKMKSKSTHAVPISVEGRRMPL